MTPQPTPYLDEALVDNAVNRWKTGGLVAMPTETVYGLAADACNGKAVASIYQVKSRPQFNPLIVHVADAEAAMPLVQWNGTAQQLADAFWPGALTMVLPRAPACSISALVSAGGDTLAIRVPSHPMAQQLLKAFGGAVAAPSANRSGRVSPTTAQHVRDELGEAAALIIDGGPCEVGLESTVVDLTGEVPRVLRPGSITFAMMQAVIPGLSQDLPAMIAQQRIPGRARDDGLKSPGQLESHYAPSIPVRLNATSVAADEALLAFGAALPGAAATANLSPSGDLVEAAAHLFACLRQLDQAQYSGIAVMPIPEEGIGAAINDRLRRAAA